MLSPQVLLKEPRVLRPAEFVEGGEDDLPDGRSWLRGPEAGARGAAELPDQLVAALVEPVKQGGLGDEFGDGHVGVLRVFSKTAGKPQGLLKCGGKIVTDSSQAHPEDCTPQPCELSMAPMRLTHGGCG